MRSLLFIGICFHLFGMAMGQNTEIDSLKRVLAATPDNPDKVNTLQNLSYAYVSASPDTALKYAIEGLALAQSIKDLRGESYCLNALGNVYFNVGDYPLALEMYFKSLEIKERLKDQQQAIAVTYFNISNVYTEQKDYEHALSYLFKTKQVDEKSKDTAGIMYDLYTLSNIYERMNNADSALFYIQQAYDLVQQLQDKNMIGAVMNTYAGVYLLKKDFPLAEKYYRLSVDYTIAVNDNEVLTSTYYGLAAALKGQKRLDSSIYYLRKSLAVAQEGNFLKQVMETSNLLTEMFKAKKRYDSALKYQELGIAIKDSMFNSEKMKKVQNLKLVEQQRQHEKETASIEFRSKVRLYIVFFASTIFLLITFWHWRNNKQRRRAFGLLQEEKSRTEEAYQELKLTQAQLIHSEKMASLGELTAGIAHEIQNPLNFVNNFSEVNQDLIAELKQEISKGTLEEAGFLADDIAANEEKINYHGKRAAAIVKGMLQHSRTGGGQKEPTDINELADEYLRLSYHGLRAKDSSINATTNTYFDEALSADKAGIGKVNVIPQDFGRMLLNLYNNAFYAVHAKALSAEAQAKADKYEPTVSVTTKRNDDGIEITVTDNGNGIPQKIIDKIFQPFFTTKPTGQGTGLGLSMSYDIAKAHGGEIRVETEEGVGSKFIVQLPLA